jgi:hypothetical protein
MHLDLDHLIGVAVAAVRAADPPGASHAVDRLAVVCGRDADFVHTCVRRAARAGTGAAVLGARELLAAGPRPGRHRAPRGPFALWSGGRRERR